MTVANATLNITRGEDFAPSWTWLTGDVPNGIAPTAVDLTGYSGNFAIRTAPDPTTTPTYTTAVTLGGVAGTVALSIPASTNLTIPEGVYSADIFLTNGSSTYKFLAATVTIR